MIELIVIWKLVTSIGSIASQKGLKKIGYQIMAVILWVCGEIFGAVVLPTFIRTNGSFLLNYLLALVGAVIGAGIAFLVMRLLPKPISGITDDININQEVSGFQKLGRSGCIPILVIVLAVFCLGVGFIGGIFKEMMSVFPQTHATNFTIGTRLDSNSQILQSVREISSDVDVIYLSFDFETAEGIEPPVTVNWIVNGQVIHSTLEYMSSGRIVKSIDRKQLGLSEFPRGVYEVNINIEYAQIASASFTVK